VTTLSYHQIALVGFTAAEYGTFETFFRLVSSRRPRPFRASREIAQASLIIVNTNESDDIDRVFSKLADGKRVITVGARRVAEAWRHLDRPINLNAVLVAIDAALADFSIAAEGSAPASAVSVAVAPVASVTLAAPPHETALSSLLPRALPIAPPVSPVVAVRTPVPTPVTTRQLPPQRIVPAADVEPKDANSLVARPPVVPPVVPQVRTLPTAVPPVSNVTRLPIAPIAPVAPATEVAAPRSVGAARVNILVVDDSDVALKFIHSRLSAFGFTVDQCSSGEEALVRVADGSYQFVFLDVMMAGLDGYQTCKAIKGRRYAGGKPPAVVMLTSRGGTIDKVRGTFAGCDAYLTKPLDETKMLKVLLKHDSEIAHALSTMMTTPATVPPPPRAPTNVPNPLAAAYEGLSNSGK
jgi:CheY-like chemotaxis protein